MRPFDTRPLAGPVVWDPNVAATFRPTYTIDPSLPQKFDPLTVNSPRVPRRGGGALVVLGVLVVAGMLLR